MKRFYDRAAWIALLVVVLAGCGSKTKPEEQSAPPTDTLKPSAAPSDPNEALHEQLSSGLFQLSATLDSIQSALKEAKDLQRDAKGALKEGLVDVVDHLDSCGATLADHNEDPPTVEEIKKNFAPLDDKRLKTIDDVNDTLSDLKESKGMVSGLTGDTDELEERVTRLAALIDQAMEDARGTLQALGGQEQLPTAAPNK